MTGQRRRRCKRAQPRATWAEAPAPHLVLALLVHRLHNPTYDRGKDRAAARAAKLIAEKTAQRPARHVRQNRNQMKTLMVSSEPTVLMNKAEAASRAAT